MIFDYVVFIAEIIGTVAFAVSGVMIAAEKQLDLFGALILGATTAVGGGIIRDVILGKFPPVTFIKPTYAFVAIIVSLLTFVVLYKWNNTKPQHITGIINICDAIGLATFAIIGVNAAHDAGYEGNMFLSCFLGVVTGVGGGVVRDMLVGKIPFILHKKIYAVATIAGTVIYSVLLVLGLNKIVSSIVSCLLIFVIRLLATHYEWTLPRLKKLN